MSQIPLGKVRYPLLTHPVVFFLVHLGLIALGIFLLANGFKVHRDLAEWGLVPTEVGAVDTVAVLILVVLGLPILVPAVGRRLYRNHVLRLIKGAQAAAMASMAKAPVEANEAKGRRWGLGIAGDTVFVVNGGIVGAIPASRIRNVSWDVPSPDQITTFGNVGIFNAMRVDAFNKAERARAENRSGLTLEVADVQFPRWFFHHTDANLLRRWSEIILQARERQARAA